MTPASPVVERPRPAMPAKPAPAGAFLSGVVAYEVANGALHLAQPLLIAHLTGSFGKAALFSSFDTAVHMGGTALAGWPADRLGSRRLLIASTFLRGAALGLIPAAWAAGRLTPGVAMGAYTLDALVRGFQDTAVHALPLELAGHDAPSLDRINARYELAFDLGAVAGPLALGGLMAGAGGLTPHVAVAAGFALAAGVFVAVPRTPPARSRAADAEKGGTLRGLLAIARDPRLLWSALGLALLNLYPLRKLLSAFFAKAILAKPASVGALGAAFGLGGAAGALLYARKGRADAAPRWVAAGAAGVLLLAAGWLPSALWPMAAAAFLFSLTNVGARLAVTTRLQEATPAGTIGGVTAAARAGSNLVSVGLKALVGLAFAIGAGPRGAFSAVGVGLALIAGLQLALASKLSTNYARVHS